MFALLGAGPAFAQSSVALAPPAGATQPASLPAEEQEAPAERLFKPAPLRPDELLLVYNAQAPASGELARYYAGLRQVPADRLLAVQWTGPGEEIGRDDFERLIRGPVRNYLEQKQLREQVRCLVTFYGLPIRVGPLPSTPRQQALLGARRQDFSATLAELRTVIETLEAARMPPTTQPPQSAPAEKDYRPLLNRYTSVRLAAWQRMRRSVNQGEASGQLQTFIAAVQQAEGLASLVPQHRHGDHAPPSAEAQQIEELKQALRQVDRRARELLARDLDDPQRGEAYQLVRQYHGLIGLLGVLEHDIRFLRTDETQAAVDSELTLLWWDNYPRYRWVMNTLEWRTYTDPQMRGQLPAYLWERPVLMVSRIDAATPRTARSMLDAAAAAEAGGLTGKVYIDARGLAEKNDMGDYDRNLRELAQLLWKHTALQVRLNGQAELFGPGQCPQAMLYSGWYSLRKYVPAFDFVPGAVAYHTASFEAVSLKDPQEQGWCKNLLEAGAAATLGPVAEPYLQAFPQPKDFFALLLTGRFTLAECFAYCNPFNSWMLMLLGDPLYRPFAARPRLRLEQALPPQNIPPVFTGASPPR